MTPFFVQIKCQLGKSYQVANGLAEAEIASEIYSTAGDYDLLVKFYVDSGTDIGTSSTRRCNAFPASRTHTPSSPSRRSEPRAAPASPARPAALASARQGRAGARARSRTSPPPRRSPRRDTPASSAVRRRASSRAAAPIASRYSRRRDYRGGGVAIAFGQKDMREAAENADAR